MKEMILELLNQANAEFNNKLITCDINIYTSKLLMNATIISIIRNNKLQSFVAYYDNDETKKNAYLSMIVTRKESRYLGYGKTLINTLLSNLKQQKFEYLGLEVLKSNTTAINIYIKNDFSIQDENETHYKMIRKI